MKKPRGRAIMISMLRQGYSWYKVALFISTCKTYGDGSYLNYTQAKKEEREKFYRRKYEAKLERDLDNI